MEKEAKESPDTMEKEAKKSPDSMEKKDNEPERRESKSGSEKTHSDFDSGRGSFSTPQASDSTSGMEMKYDATSGLPCVPELRIDPAQSDPGAAAVKMARERSPKLRSPVKAVKEGLRWMRDSLSPKKSDHSDEGSKSPKEGEHRSSSKSPDRSPIKSMFRRKSKSPAKKEKRRSQESEPFLLGDELRLPSSSSEENQKLAEVSPTTETVAVPKARHQKRKSKEHKPTAAYGKVEKGGDTEDSSTSEEALKASREKARKGLRLHLKKEHRKSKDKSQLLPQEDIEIGQWSPVRLTTDEEDYTRSPSETDMDLDSSISLRGAAATVATEATDETEREVSSTGERISKNLGLDDPVETAEGVLFKRCVLKRQMEPEGVEMMDLPDPAPSPKKQPKYDVDIDRATKDDVSGNEESKDDVSLSDETKDDVSLSEETKDDKEGSEETKKPESESEKDSKGGNK